jgi:hypothetical protein
MATNGNLGERGEDPLEQRLRVEQRPQVADEVAGSRLTRTPGEPTASMTSRWCSAVSSAVATCGSSAIRHGVVLRRLPRFLRVVTSRSRASGA